ncbi:glucose-6-phosphate dehydrogenase [Aeromicrobium sp. Leaf350]|uniref:glucose-6-phosphate dehydrogenase n=1 Tax=Aeromicrobium sp. Leaf350 TaxID=2876565 RepID=UPI001E3936C3|nr:glucose-6-phosphate dehydrogenase [Aeromicrobium sp. Leaf350]
MTRPLVLVMFGATGDLFSRKLLPSLVRLHAQGRLGDVRVIGTGRHAPDDGWVDDLREAAADAVPDEAKDSVDPVVDRISFVVSSADDGEDLAREVADAEEELGDVDRLIYLSVPPTAMVDLLAMLGDTGLADGARIVVEKPYGLDAASGRSLDAALHGVVDEDRVYRIDHFLGSAAIADLAALTPDGVQEVQVDVPETLGLEGRAGFYESTGCLRDMVVTHLAQLVGVIAAEDAEGEAWRDARAEVFEAMAALKDDDTVLGQYVGYRDEDDVDDGSTVETYAATILHLQDGPWSGIPFVVRTGKNLAVNRSVVTVLGLDGSERVIDVDAAEEGEALDPYARLLAAVAAGDASRFVRGDHAEQLWRVVGPVLDDDRPPVPYEPGSWGPAEADELPGAAGWSLARD